ncbi:H-type lectin domain-containing protein [Prosthecobacter fusiformis]|uniref:H-type lectin domain-containing protein n=1 Tax=Prosthecobacter fusiformis TaxID=48464 RepID=A0A4R7S719_9BACT|nr:H-type lectin domain-containing protein [Prosthecobacter fusiformis]TDU73368.1 H-type lectin domain-containing protein [Prosthecobacter fusiformis]
MYSTSVPWKVLSSQVSVSVLLEDWNLANNEPEADTLRSYVVQVVFDSPFLSVPVVHLGLTGFDIDQRDSARLTVKAESITESGFQAVISTWSNTRVYAAELNWLAIGS